MEGPDVVGDRATTRGAAKRLRQGGRVAEKARKTAVSRRIRRLSGRRHGLARGMDAGGGRRGRTPRDLVVLLGIWRRLRGLRPPDGKMARAAAAGAARSRL